MGWACTFSPFIPSLLTLVQNGTRRTAIGSVATAALEAGTGSAGAGAEIGVTGTSAVPPETDEGEGTRTLGSLAGLLSAWVYMTVLCMGAVWSALNLVFPISVFFSPSFSFGSTSGLLGPVVPGDREQFWVSLSPKYCPCLVFEGTIVFSCSGSIWGCLGEHLSLFLPLPRSSGVGQYLRPGL